MTCAAFLALFLLVSLVALVGVLKRSGYPPLACRSETRMRVRMYDGTRSLAEGFTKSSAQLVRERWRSGALVVQSTACSAPMLPALFAAVCRGGCSVGSGCVYGRSENDASAGRHNRKYGLHPQRLSGGVFSWES
jgi:hypothetical protein